jgi:DNA primase
VGIVDEDIDRVRASVSLLDVVQERVTLRRQGSRWIGLCPFHAEKTPSFGVSEELGIWKCFGCGAGGDVIDFVRAVDHLDFVGAIEWLAARGGIQLRYTSSGEGRDRRRRQRLVDAMAAAVAWYHERLLTAPDAGPARHYLRSRGIDGALARRFQLGWAPDDWDALVGALGQEGADLIEAGLAFVNRRDRMQDAFRGRVMFPIYNEAGDPVAFGGRVLPGSSDPAKYKNSPETPIYAKGRTLYGLNWAKSAVVAGDEVVVCEGYTDVIGFHHVGVVHAVATCGTALTEDHARLLTRFAKRFVLAFDADSAGQGAAERVYDWERRLSIEVAVARLPAGTDPGELSGRDPDALRAAVGDAQPFLGFRVDRVLRSGSTATPERRARLAEAAMAAVNEHPDVNVRRLYAGQVASHCGLAVADLVRMAEARAGPVRVTAPPRPAPQRDNAEAVALALLVHHWDAIAPWLVEALFTDDVNVAAFRAMADAQGDVRMAMALADPAARELLERLAVTDVQADADVEARTLIGAAARRELDRIAARAAAAGDLAAAAEHREQTLVLHRLDDPEGGLAAAEQLLRWLGQRHEERV